MRWFAINFSRWHLGILIAFWLVFSGLTLAIVSTGLDDAAQHPMRVAATTAASVLGPMTGAISRNFQSCCLECSLSLLPPCFTALFLAVFAQVIRLPDVLWLRVVRLVIWSAGLFVWFGGGIVSFAHALS